MPLNPSPNEQMSNTKPQRPPARCLHGYYGLPEACAACESERLSADDSSPPPGHSLNHTPSATLHDFQDGNGPVPAHQHANGGGWVADTAKVEPSAQVFSNAQVCGNAQVSGNARVCDNADIFQIGPIGSRNDTLTICRTTEGWQAATGCWLGTLDDFKAAVVKQHGEHSHYGQQYAAALDFADRMLVLAALGGEQRDPGVQG